MTFCSHSTDESIQNEQISILAIFEISISIIIYWGIASYFDYYYHIYFSLAVAPLFLLRTQKSEKEALEFLSHFFNKEKESFAKDLLIYLIFFCTLVLVTSIIYYPISFLITNYQEFDLLWRMLIFGVIVGLAILSIVAVDIIVEAVRVGVVGVTLLLGTKLGVMFSAFTGIELSLYFLLSEEVTIAGKVIGVGEGVMGVILVGVIVVGLILRFAKKSVTGPAIVGVVVILATPLFVFTVSSIKIFFTLKNIFDAFKKIPHNWNKLIIYQDMYVKAEIIPGINKFNGMNGFKFMHLKSSAVDSKQGIENRFMNALFLAILYAFTIIYRISLKSTSLFYWILFIHPFRINKKYDNKSMKEVITEEQKVYSWFPVIMILIFLSVNMDFGAIDSFVKHIEGRPFYPYIKHFLSYFIFSSIVCGLMWLIAKMFLIGDKNSSEGFPRMLLNGLLKLLKISVSISIMLYMYHLYNLFNVSDVIKMVFEYYTNLSIL